MEPMKESIFISAIKSFCKGFFSIMGIFFAFILGTLLLVMFLSKDTSSNKISTEILPDLNGNTDLLPSSTPVVMQIDIEGIIGMKEMTEENVKTQLIESRKKEFKNNRVKAILLNINTRGGSAITSDNIYCMLNEYKNKYNVPIFAFINGLNASGGVYISCAADKIFSTPVSLIGSVGVVMGPFLNVYKTLEKIGINSLTLTDGKGKDAMNPLRPWKEGEADNFREIGDYYYNRFLDIVTNSRSKLTKDDLISKYGAKIFPAPQAEEYGYIDNGNSSYEEAVLALLKAANINEAKPYQMVKLKPKKKWVEDIFDSNSLFKGKMKHELSLIPEEKENISYLYTL